MEIVLWILGIGFGLWAVKALRTPVPDAPTQTSRVISNPPISNRQSVGRGQRTASQLSPRELQRKREDERQRRDWDDDGLGVVGVAVLADNDWGNTRSDPTPVRDDSIVARSAEVSPAPVSARVDTYDPPTRYEDVYEAPSRSYDSGSSDSGSSYSSDSGGSSDSGSSSSFD